MATITDLAIGRISIMTKKKAPMIPISTSNVMKELCAWPGVQPANDGNGALLTFSTGD
jgi:hypothetical protein